MTYHSLSANNVGDTQSELKLTSILHIAAVLKLLWTMISTIINTQMRGELVPTLNSQYMLYIHI